MNLFASISRMLRSPQRRSTKRRVPLDLTQTLETRVLPATFVNPTTMTYTDVDGDDVSVTFSNPILTASNVNSVFQFNRGSVNGNNVFPQQLQKISLTGIARAAGTSITTVATRNFVRGGDGFAATGQIDATGLDLRSVTLDGDLGRILAGDQTYASAAITSLSVQSMGRFGKVTGAIDLNSDVRGAIGTLTVKGDIKGAFLSVTGEALGRIDTVNVGGSIIGGKEAYSGRIHASGNIGKVTIGGDVIGGQGTHSGVVSSFGSIAGISIGGSLIGGSNTFAGSILTDARPANPATGHIGSVTIRRDILGGSDTGAGSIVSETGRVGNVTVGGSLIAGSAGRSAHVFSKQNMGLVNIAGNLIGGTGDRSGQIECRATLAGVTIGGSVIGGNGQHSGEVFSQASMHNVTVRQNIIGGTGPDSGNIFCGQDMQTLIVGGSLIGGASDRSGRIYVGHDIVTMNLAGSAIGGAGTESGTVNSQGITNAQIGGSVRGGSGEDSGTILGRAHAITTLRVNGDVIGGNGIGSGRIFARDFVTANIGGSIIGGTKSRTGGIFAAESISNMTVGGNLRGGSMTGEADLIQTGVIVTNNGRIGTLTLGGSLIAGVDGTSGTFLDNGAIRAADDIGTLTIKGSVVGNVTHAAQISARGQRTPPAASDLAIRTLNVNGRVEYALIYAGADSFGRTNADAQIGSVSVGGDWVASNLVAGGHAGNDGLFGSLDDTSLSGQLTRDRVGVNSLISSIRIGGQLIGTEFTSDLFGFVAESVTAISVGGNNVPMLAGFHNDHVLLVGEIDGLFGDVWVKEY